MKKMIAAMVICAFATTGAMAHEASDPRPAQPTEEAAKAPAPQRSVNKPSAKPHSGGTDARGCHTNHSTGDYHCHNPK